ncbi:MAG TPA: MHYT domain-containing protein [Stellaceae bacterium]|nr:MHYT domain-containing protein [Stellaceae bacterium]
MLIVTYDPWLVAASVVIAIMASFTGLRLASSLKALAGGRRRLQIAKAAFALGGGIWSMHFVAMLAVQLPIALGYDALYTLGSVLISILITGVGLGLMFVGERTLARTVGAGTLTGLGIVSMHYVGMAAVSGYCSVSYAPVGFFLSSGIAILFSICALGLVSGRHTLAQLSFGAVVLGVTISGMHYSAMAFTRFTELADAAPVATPVIQSEYLALIVLVAAFCVCGVFLLTALPLESAAREAVPSPVAESPPPGGAPAPLEEDAEPPLVREEANGADHPRLPYEQHNAIYFVDAERIHAIKAEGHYTRLYDGAEVYFCPWSISKVEAHVAGHSFLRTHRSFLVNLRHARAFQRKDDKAYLIVPAVKEAMVPVSRFHLAEVRRALGI